MNKRFLKALLSGLIVAVALSFINMLSGEPFSVTAFCVYFVIVTILERLLSAYKEKKQKELEEMSGQRKK